MGMFPYDCPTCGGGFERCGNSDPDHDEDCQGEQFCWDVNCVIVLKPSTFAQPHAPKGSDAAEFLRTHAHPKRVQNLGKGTYEGYGHVILSCIPDSRIMFADASKAEYVADWFKDHEQFDSAILVDVYCSDCELPSGVKQAKRKSGKRKHAEVANGSESLESGGASKAPKTLEPLVASAGPFTVTTRVDSATGTITVVVGKPHAATPLAIEMQRRLHDAVRAQIV